MQLGDFKFTDKLQQLYNDTVVLDPLKSINFKIVKQCRIPGAAGCCHKEQSGNYTIEIKEDYVNEDIISHEILHCYLQRKLYPEARSIDLEGDIAYLGEYLQNVITHKLVYQEQKKRGIDYSKRLESTSTTYLSIIIDENLIENDFVLQLKYSIRVLEALLYCQEYYYLFKDNIRKRFLNSYNYAIRLFRILTKTDYQTAYEIRKVFVNVLKEINQIYAENNYILPNLNLNIELAFTASQWQLDLYPCQVFDFHRNAFKYNEDLTFSILVTKSDKQNSRFINSEFNDSVQFDFDKIKLKDFFAKYDIPYGVR